MPGNNTNIPWNYICFSTSKNVMTPTGLTLTITPFRRCSDKPLILRAFELTLFNLLCLEKRDHQPYRLTSDLWWLRTGSQENRKGHRWERTPQKVTFAESHTPTPAAIVSKLRLVELDGSNGMHQDVKQLDRPKT